MDASRPQRTWRTWAFHHPVLFFLVSAIGTAAYAWASATYGREVTIATLTGLAILLFLGRRVRQGRSGADSPDQEPAPELSFKGAGWQMNAVRALTFPTVMAILMGVRAASESASASRVALISAVTFFLSLAFVGAWIIDNRRAQRRESEAKKKPAAC